MRFGGGGMWCGGEGCGVVQSESDRSCPPRLRHRGGSPVVVQYDTRTPHINDGDDEPCEPPRAQPFNTQPKRAAGRRPAMCSRNDDEASKLP